MKVTVCTCDNCNARLPKIPKGRRQRLGGKPVDLCASCLSGNVPVNLDAPLEDWPRFVPSAALAPLLAGLRASTGRRTSALMDDLRPAAARELAAAAEEHERTVVAASSEHDTVVAVP